MIIKKTLKEILFQVGFRRQEKRLSMFYIINRKGISKIVFYVAKKKIKGSVERNIIKRRIRLAYKILIKKIEYLQIKVIFFLCWETKKIPYLKKIEYLIEKNFMTNVTF